MEVLTVMPRAADVYNLSDVDPYDRRLADSGAESASHAARQLRRWRMDQQNEERHLQT